MTDCRTCDHPAIQHDDPRHGGTCLVTGCMCLEYREKKAKPAPDVQAQDDPTSASLRTHRNLLGLDDVQAQIDTYKNAYLAAVAECGRLEEMIYAARAEEREACAMVADSHAWRIGTELADQIRARSGARGV